MPMRVVAENQEMRFYGKTTRGEFVWFVIFMGAFCFIGFVVSVWGLSYNSDNFLAVLFLSLIVLAISLGVLYVGIQMKWDTIGEGKHAVERFKKDYERGKLPKLRDVFIEEYNGEESMKFIFDRGTWKLSVWVYIPMREYRKLSELLDGKIAEEKDSEGVMEIKLKDGRRIYLEGDERESYRFLKLLWKTQRDRIKKVVELREKLMMGEIDVQTYVREVMKY